MQRADLAGLLAAAGLQSRQQLIEQLARPSIRIHTTAAAAAPGSSRLGGQPDLPAQSAWPLYQGTPMAFVAQIRLSDVSSLNDLLPHNGTLWFFYDASQRVFGDTPHDRGGWQVIYDPGEHAGPPHAAPADLPADARFQASAATFATELTLPVDPSAFVPDGQWSQQDQQRYETLLDHTSSPDERSTPHHRMLGHPDQIQDDMRRQCALLAHGLSDETDPAAAALLEHANDWVLLLQIDSDEQAGMRWASNGMLYYWIEQAALQQAQF